jgi:hypothetical protein
MKVVVFTLGIFAAGVLQAAQPGLPQGAYAGTATWRGPGGATGTYAVERTFSGNTIGSRYAWTQPEARKESFSLTLVMKESGPLFDVLDEKKQVVGSGYCYDDTCAYRSTFGPVTVDETLRWSEGSIIATGAKSGPGFSVVWKEILKAR